MALRSSSRRAMASNWESSVSAGLASKPSSSGTVSRDARQWSTTTFLAMRYNQAVNSPVERCS